MVYTSSNRELRYTTASRTETMEIRNSVFRRHETIYLFVLSMCLHTLISKYVFTCCFQLSFWNSFIIYEENSEEIKIWSVFRFRFRTYEASQIASAM